MKADVKILTGSAGSGKSTRIYEELVDLAAAHPKQRFYLIVPEQSGSSMEQRILKVNRERTGRAGFFNIDIIGFTRLAYRIFEEQGKSMRQVLEDYGKTILLRSVVGKVRSDLELYSGSVDRQGFIDELKSLFSEFLMFDIGPEELENALEALPEQHLHLKRKLKDVLTIYRAFREDSAFIEQYMVAEELPAYLARLLAESEDVGAVDGAVFYFDGFTGFTAAQRKVLGCLTNRAASMTFTITLDPEDTRNLMFEQSTEMLEQLIRIAPDADLLTQPELPVNTPLRFLTKQVFRFPVVEYKGGEGGKESLLGVSGISVWRTVNSVEELRVVAEDIRDRVRSGNGSFRYRDAAILTADPDGVGGYVDLVMREYGLPYFTDRTRTFVNNPIIDAQLFVLEMLDRDFTYESVFAFLKTGVLERAVQELGLDSGVTEWLENFVIAHGIRGKKLWQKPVEHFVGGAAAKEQRERTETEENQLEQMEELRQLFLSILEPVLPFAGGKQYSVSRMIRGLSSLAEDPRLGLSERGDEAENDLTKMGYPAEAKAYPGIYEKYLSVLEKTESILGNRKMTLHELRETLLIGVREIRIGVIPPTLDSVLIGDLVRTRIGNVKVLYVIGFNEGILPKPKSSGGLLSDRDRTRLEEALEDSAVSGRKESAGGAGEGISPGFGRLAPDETKKRFREQFALYLAFSKPTEQLIITYAEKSKSTQEMEKSFLLGRIERLFPMLREEKRIRKQVSGNVIPDRLEYMRLLEREEEQQKKNEKTAPGSDPERENEEKGVSIADQIVMKALAEVFPEIPKRREKVQQGREMLPPELMHRLNVRVSVSQLEKYANCPYAYFLRYILKLAPRRTHLMRELDVGEILHKTLELVFQRVKREHKNDWKNLPEEKLTSLVQQAVGDAIREKKPELLEEEHRDGKTDLTLTEIGELAETTVDMLRSQLSGSKLLPEVMEGDFSAEFEAEGPNGRKETVRINGVIDRLDTWTSPEDGTVFLRILDYKTGDKKMDLRDLRDGRNLQLTVYLRILTEIFRQKAAAAQEGKSAEQGAASAEQGAASAEQGAASAEQGAASTEGQDEVSVFPAGMYYYHVDEPVLTKLGKDFSSEEEAAREEMEKALKLRGVPNISPTEEGGALPKHYIVELQDPDAVDESRNLQAAKILPIKVAKSTGVSPTEGSVLATTELMDGIGEYAVFKMKEMTEHILRGDIRKLPTRVSGRQKGACDYCDSAVVCRFRKNESRENYVPKAPSQDAIMAELSETGKKHRVPLKNAKMKSSRDEETFLDMLLEDADEESDE